MATDFDTVDALRRLLASDARRDPGSKVGAIKRIANLQRENRALRRANEILTTASALFAAAELDRKLMVEAFNSLF